LAIAQAASLPNVAFLGGKTVEQHQTVAASALNS